jgi:glycosyltransferase involved in cell wall biosynthesis
MPDGGEWPRITGRDPLLQPDPLSRSDVALDPASGVQGYPNLEYFVFDGGSTDGSIEIIKKYEPWLASWVSEPDGGQSAAINRGLRLSTGLFTTWINSDDMLCRDALSNHATRVGFNPSMVYVGDCLYINQHDNVDHEHRARVHSFEDLVRIRTVWRAPGHRGNIDQPAVLFPRELALNVGGVNVANHWTMDYELWGRFFLAGARFEYTRIPFGMFRVHEEQKTAQGWATTQSLIATAVSLVTEARDLPDHVRSEIIADLYAHEHDYWRETGRLARLGLPQRVVRTLRDTRAIMTRRARRLVRRTS